MLRHPFLIQYKLHFYAEMLSAKLRCSNAANLILLFLIKRKNDRNDFNVKM